VASAAVSSPLVLGMATQASTDLLHAALSSWRQCHGRVVFTEPGQVFILKGGYLFAGNLTLDASALAKPVTLRTDEPTPNGLMAFIPGTWQGVTTAPSIVARNIVFADHRRVRTEGSGGTYLMGGVISMQGGACSAVFEACTFRNNELFLSTNGTGGCGAAAIRIAKPTLARFDDCVFENNAATCHSNSAAGGAVSIVEPLGPVSFSRCRWRNNKVIANMPNAGAARPFASGAAVFLSNEPAGAARQPISFSQCVFEGNEAHATPLNTEANLDVVACGAVCGETHVVRHVALDMSFTQCTFAGNTAAAHLPPGTAGDAKARLTVYGAAASFFAGATADFTDCVIKENAAHIEDHSPVAGNTNRVYGGGVLLNGATASFTATRFVDNSAIGPVDARGGGLYAMGANSPTLAAATRVDIARSIFSGNHALALGAAGRHAYGGAVGVVCSSSSSACGISVEVVGSNVVENSATLQETVATTGAAAAFARKLGSLCVGARIMYA
jgi:hypothetical protein